MSEKKNKLTTAKAVFLMLVGKGPGREVKTQLKTCFSKRMKKIRRPKSAFKMELVLSLDSGQTEIQFNSFK